MKADTRLIRVRRAQPRLARTAWGMVTLLAWLAYVYLWLPVLTLVMWAFGLRDMYGELYQRSEQLDPFVLFILPVLATLSSCALLAWAEYNRLRFTGQERRGAFPDVPVHEIAATLGTAPHVPGALRAHRVCVLQMDDDAHPADVTPVDVARLHATARRTPGA